MSRSSRSESSRSCKSKISRGGSVSNKRGSP